MRGGTSPTTLRAASETTAIGDAKMPAVRTKRHGTTVPWYPLIRSSVCYYGRGGSGEDCQTALRLQIHLLLNNMPVSTKVKSMHF